MRAHAIPCLIALMLALLPASTLAQAAPPWRDDPHPARERAEITVGEVVVPVEIARSAGETSLGLGYRNGMEWDSGMLFVFSDASVRTFWMKGMRFCLDIIWIVDGEIVGAAESVCPAEPGTPDAELERYSSGVPVTHVLEMNAGWLAENGFGPGTPVLIPDPWD